MQVVFVETNWIVAVCAPPHLRSPAALELLARAGAGEVEIHVPAVCFAEATRTIPRRYKPRTEASNFRDYLSWARADQGRVDPDLEAALRVVNRFESTTSSYLQRAREEVAALRTRDGIHGFALDEQMLERAIELGAAPIDLKPIDEAILAAVLVKVADLAAQGHRDMLFCELDSDLQPWDRKGQPRSPLAEWFSAAGLTVLPDFKVPR